jgi:RimJ/RimL family protein N-acetyltransferase
VSNDAHTQGAATATVEASGLKNLPYEAVEVSTDRLVLRPLTEDDIETAQSYRNREGVARYLLWEVHEREQGEEPFAGRRALRRLEHDGDGLVFAVEMPDANGGHSRVIGDMSVFLKSAADAQLEVGWVFHPAVHGRGYATEAAQALLRVCFETLGAHRVVAELDPRNEVSARLCDTLGMRREGHYLENVLVDGAWTDTCIHAILDREFAALTA